VQQSDHNDHLPRSSPLFLLRNDKDNDGVDDIIPSTPLRPKREPLDCDDDALLGVIRHASETTALAMQDHFVKLMQPVMVAHARVSFVQGKKNVALCELTFLHKNINFARFISHLCTI